MSGTNETTAIEAAAVAYELLCSHSVAEPALISCRRPIRLRAAVPVGIETLLNPPFFISYYNKPYHPLEPVPTLRIIYNVVGESGPGLAPIRPESRLEKHLSSSVLLSHISARLRSLPPYAEMRLRVPDMGSLSAPLAAVSRNLPPLNFITIHYIYFIATCLLTAIIFWGSSTPAQSVTFTDSLFLTISAMTGAGLNTINLSTLNTWQQVILFVLIGVGSPIFVSAFVVLVRKRAFERRFDDVIKWQ